MKNILVLIFGLAALSALAMDSGDGQIHDALKWLTKDSSYMAPEKAVQLEYDWKKGMSFLNRYIIGGFNVADVYEDVVFFNEWEYSTDTYKLTYPQIKGFLVALSQLPQIKTAASTDQLQQKYLELINKWKELDVAQPEYRHAWINGDWQFIRKKLTTSIPDLALRNN